MITNPLLKKMQEEGCSVQETLDDTMMGNENFYVKMLKKLSNNGCLDRMAAASDAQQVEACFDAGHELKGMYATLGLTPLFEPCRDIVEITRAGKLDGVADAIANLKKLHKHFLEIIANN